MKVGLIYEIIKLQIGANIVAVSYKKLWKIFIDREMVKKDLQMTAKLSWASVTKMS